MSDKPGVRIQGRFYPFVDKFKHGDPILIYEVTGLDWDTFAEKLEQAEEDEKANPIVQTALIAVAVQREHPGWSRHKVNEFIRNLDLGAEEFEGIEPDEDGGVLPPSSSGESSKSSDETSAAPPEESPSSLSLIASPSPGASTTSPESHQVA